MACRVKFAESAHAPIELAERTNLAEQLTVVNSPVLFGCRTGICGTCLVEITDGLDGLSPAGEAELEALECYAPGNPRARLACQIDLNCDISLRKIECS